MLRHTKDTTLDHGATKRCRTASTRANRVRCCSRRKPSGESIPCIMHGLRGSRVKSRKNMYFRPDSPRYHYIAADLLAALSVSSRLFGPRSRRCGGIPKSATCSLGDQGCAHTSTKEEGPFDCPAIQSRCPRTQRSTGCRHYATARRPSFSPRVAAYRDRGRHRVPISPLEALGRAQSRNASLSLLHVAARNWIRHADHPPTDSRKCLAEVFPHDAIDELHARRHTYHPAGTQVERDVSMAFPPCSPETTNPRPCHRRRTARAERKHRRRGIFGPLVSETGNLHLPAAYQDPLGLSLPDTAKRGNRDEGKARGICCCFFAIWVGEEEAHSPTLGRCHRSSGYNWSPRGLGCCKFWTGF
jgi:hypothetical protein